MWTLAGFADEISPELDEQLDTLTGESIRFVELRSVWNKNVLDLTDEEIRAVGAAMSGRGIGVSSIGSPIGKVPIDEDFAPHLERFRRALHVAKVLKAPYVRVFSFFVPAGKDPAVYREAEAAGVVLVHENEKEIYGDVPSRCLDILTQVDSPYLRAAWDAANFVQCGVDRPYQAGYHWLRPYVEYVHVKDALAGSGTVVPAGEGDGEIRETISALHGSGFDGFFSLEPHLASAGRYSGFSGPELFGRAAGAFKNLLRQGGIPWS
jgi:sugar phosphate isomerase/epimerase